MDASADATITQQPQQHKTVVIEDALPDAAEREEAAKQLLGAAESNEAAEQLLGAAAVDQVRTMLSDPAVVSCDPNQPLWNVFATDCLEHAQKPGMTLPESQL